QPEESDCPQGTFSAQYFCQFLGHSSDATARFRASTVRFGSRATPVRVSTSRMLAVCAARKVSASAGLSLGPERNDPGGSGKPRWRFGSTIVSVSSEPSLLVRKSIL